MKKGQLLFEIDPRPFQAALDQANGQVAQYQGQLAQANSQITQAEAQLAQANSQLLQAQAQLEQAQANHVKTDLDVKKYRPLAEQKAVTQQDLDNALQANTASKAQVDAQGAGVEAARAQIAHAKAQINTAKAGVATATGQLENAQAAVKTAALNLGFTRIVSPIDGVAGLAQAQVGDLVSTTSNALTTVSTLDPIKVYFTLSEQDYLRYTKPFLGEAEQNGSLDNLELELILSDGIDLSGQRQVLFRRSTGGSEDRIDSHGWNFSESEQRFATGTVWQSARGHESRGGCVDGAATSSVGVAGHLSGRGCWSQTIR